MSKLGIVGATALSLALAVATPAFAAGGVGGGGGMHVGGVGGGGGMHVGGVGGAQASIGGRVGSVSGGNFTGRTGRGDGQFAQGGYRGDHDRHHRHGREFGFAAGLAAGSALGYGYGGYDDPYYYGGSYDPYYYNDDSAYNDLGYDGYSGSVVSSGTDPSYCAQRYKSYDPASGTYLGRDGLRHPCP